MPALNVALLWHMHQPNYRNPASDVYELPWVRLRAAKDYVHMLEVLADYPDVRMTINWTPVLLAQLEDYAQGRARDRWLEIARRRHRSPVDKSFMLTHFFSINWDRVVRRYPGYGRLLALREAAGSDPSYLAESYWDDLAVWFNLAWFDPGQIQRDPALHALVERGSGFGAADLETVVARQERAAAEVLPRCRELLRSGQVEMTTTPYHHPILPLLLDTASAREASPWLALPTARTGWTEDARAQVAAAVGSHAVRFGQPARGMWPSEGALSQSTVELLAGDYGLAWVATDEGILARALHRGMERDGDGNLLHPHVLYQPYAVAGGRLAIFFRDLLLSDRIGFTYSHMDTTAAVDDFIWRLYIAQNRLGADADRAVVSVILDGENCWEHYPSNGDDFLRGVCQRLTTEPGLRSTTFSDYLAKHPPRRQIERLPAGSWIGSNLETWIGEPAQNRAWDELARARAYLHAAGVPTEPPEQASGPWGALWASEASDWFWWYYSRNQVGPEDLFDALYREHLSAIYSGLRTVPPPWLAEPLTDLAAKERIHAPRGPVRPALRAELAAGAEWEHAGWVAPETSTGTMQRAATPLRRLMFGWSPVGLALRVEAGVDLGRYRVCVQLGAPDVPRDDLPLGVPALPNVATYLLVVFEHGAVRILRWSQGAWPEVAATVAWAARDGVLECVVPVTEVRPPQGSHVELRVMLLEGDQVAETLPTAGTLALDCPQTNGEGGEAC